MRNCIFRYVGFLAAVSLGVPVLAQPMRCSQGTVVGTYALSYDGTVLATAPGTSQTIPIPLAGLAVVSIDPSGAMWAVGVQNTGANSMQMPFMPAGTMAVNSDCTGAVNWNPGMGTATMIILGDGEELNTMMTQCGPAAGGPCVIHGTWKRIYRWPSTVDVAHCSPVGVFGTYVYRQNGYIMVPAAGSPLPASVPFTTLGFASFGYDGAAQGNGTVSTGGQTRQYGIANGNIQAKSDCTGTFTANFISQGVNLGQFQAWFVALDGGNQIWAIGTQDPSGKPVALGTMTRVSYMPMPGK